MPAGGEASGDLAPNPLFLPLPPADSLLGINPALAPSIFPFSPLHCCLSKSTHSQGHVQDFSGFKVHANHPGILLKADSEPVGWGAPGGVQGGGVPESAFLTSSQVSLVLAGPGEHFTSKCASLTRCPVEL